jgi:hypothetical protein
MIEDNTFKHPFPGNVLMRVDRMDEYDDETRTPVNYPVDANVVSSNYLNPEGDTHRPVLDIDFPAKLIPSSTPGHFHLYLDRSMPWADYEKFLRVCGEVGILEPGYVSVSVERKHTAVRVPWLKKGMNPADALRGYAKKLVGKLVSAY